MIKAALFGLSLMMNTAAEPYRPPAGEAPRSQLSLPQKNAVIQPLMRHATDCILRAVAADPALRGGMAAADINELIVNSMQACVDAMQAMIATHDELFGEGSGEAFFMGPYLEVLPRAVARHVHGNIN